MNFSTVSIVKHPIDRVWIAMRDDLPKLVDLLEDIESISVELNEQGPHIHKVVNIWKACPQLPQSIAMRLDSDMFVWTDRAEWNEEKRECLWSIEVHHFRDRVRCSGLTSFGSAMGGRGTRVTFAGSIGWHNRDPSKVTGFLEEAVYKSVEALMRDLVPRNFRKITDALAKHLDANVGELGRKHAQEADTHQPG
jgi:hypothetical protein